MDTKSTIKSYYDDLVAWRRDFHAHPETGFQEIRTSRRIIEILSDMDLEIIHGFCKTAVIAIIKGELPGPVIGIRADMDALPVVDGKDVSYKSLNPGVCHACGHDAHITVALGVAKYYASNKDKLKGTLKIVFQPAEEGPAPGGAKPIIESGKVDDVEFMLGCHTNPDNPTGTLLLRRNEMLASADNFTVVIKGAGGHGAYPHQTKDAVRVGFEVYNALQHLITREVDPVQAAVLSVCSFNAGTPKGTNVIPSQIVMSGTIRSFSNEIRDHLVARVEEVISTLCTLHGCTYELDISTVSIALNNDNELVEMMETVGRDVYGKENVRYMERPEMSYDDFAYFGQNARAAYFYFGTTHPDDLGKFTFHQPLYDVDETSMIPCVEMMVRLTDHIARTL